MATATALSVSSIMIVYVLIMIIATVFVYKDAKKRNMNGGLWGVVAFFGPFLIGVIIYLVCRNPITDLQCPKCGSSVKKTEKNCSQCGAALLNKCPECEFPVQKGWQSCPKCGTAFPENYSQPIKTYKKENGVGIVILIIIIAVIGLGVVSCGLFAVNGVSGVGYAYTGNSVGMYNITEEDLSKNEDIKAWIKDSNESKKDVHVLFSKENNACIVYVKDSEYLLTSNEFEINNFGDSIESCIYINESEYEDLYGYDFFYFEFTDASEEAKIKVFLNRDEMKPEITITDKDISAATWRD